MNIGIIQNKDFNKLSKDECVELLRIQEMQFKLLCGLLKCNEFELAEKIKDLIK